MEKVIALNADYGYIDRVEVTLKSILYNVQNVKIYLLNYDIPQEWFANINHYSKQIGSEIIDLKFNPQELRDLSSPFAHINQMAFARLLIPKLIKEDRVLYMDCDAIVDDNIDKLFSWDFKGKKILAVPDVLVLENVDEMTKDEPVHQINSGVLLINNKELRKDPNLSEKLLAYGRKNQFKMGDQEIIDRYFKGEIGVLPLKYNYTIGTDSLVFWASRQDLIELLDKEKDPKIIHYMSDDKPCNLFSEGRMRDRWWFYHDLNMIQIVDKFGQYDPNQVRKQTYRGELFTFTNSQDLEHLEELVQKLTDYHFNIAAWTDMGWDLKVLMKYPNVNLYPYVIGKRLDNIFEKMTAYLDINQGNKETDIIKRVEDNNLPILAFESTANKDSNYPNYKIVGDDQIDEMVAQIKKSEI